MNALLTKSLLDRNISTVVNFPQKLMTGTEEKYVDWVKTYSLRHGSTPSLERFRKQFPLFIPEEASDPLSDIFDQELAIRKSRYTIQFLAEHRDEIVSGIDPTERIRDLYESLTLCAEGVINYNNYDRLQYLEDVNSRKLKFNIQAVDDATGGFSGGELIYLIGRPASNKTTFATWLASRWWLDGLRIMFISNESPAIDIIGKMDAFLGGWNPIKQRTGMWSEKERRRVRAVAAFASSSEAQIIFPEDPVREPSQLLPLINHHKPDIVIIDGVYLMRDLKVSKFSTWEGAAAISRALKQTALKTGTRIFGISQANRKAEGKDVSRATVGFTDAYLQDADVMFAVNKSGDMLNFELLKNRWGSPVAFSALMDFEAMNMTIKKSDFEPIGAAAWE